MKPHHTVKAISDFATTLGLILLLALYGLGAQWLYQHARVVFEVYLILSFPFAYIVCAAFKVGSDS